MVNPMPDLCVSAELSHRLFRGLLCFGGMVVVAAAIGQTFAQSLGPDSNYFEHCRAISDDTARLRCYEEAKPAPGLPPQTPGAGTSTWRLVRTPNSAGGKDAVSIMKTADITKSDIDLAGMMLRCGESRVEVVLVLVRPLPPRAHPEVTVSAGGKTTEFTATIVPPGAEVLLPEEASALASGPWQTASELSVQIGAVEGEGPNPVRGVISLAGFDAALPLLLANCPSP
jgi:hypothetical protein